MTPELAQGLTAEDLAALTKSGVVAPALAPLSRHLVVERFEPSATIVREGEHGRDMYFVLAGSARVLRGGMPVATAGPGDFFGELGLVVGRPRSATVVALEPLRVGRLEHARYEALAASDPVLALRLTQWIVATLGHELTDMTDSVGLLLQQRSLPRRTRVHVRVGEETREVRTGTRVGSLLAASADATMVAALVDRKPVSLDTPLTSDAEIAPLTTEQWEGRRVLRRSVGLLLLEAAHVVAPERPVRIGASVPFGCVVDVEGLAPADAEVLAARLQPAMRVLVKADVEIRTEWWSVEEASAYFAERGDRDAVDLLRTARGPTVPMASCGAAYALATGPFVPRAGMLEGTSVRAREGALVLAYDERAGRATEAPPPRCAPNAEDGCSPSRWLAKLGIDSVGALNRACVDGEVSTIIHVAEGFHEKRVGQIADRVTSQRGLRAICIAGPSSSGKTTFIRRLATQLQVNGLRPVGLSLDDYYVDRARTPRDASGRLDFEALEALDLAALSRDLGRALRGEAVETPRYDFTAGKSLPGQGPRIALEPGDVLLLEGIHGLDPRLLEGVLASDEVHRIFVQPSAGLRFDRLTRVDPIDVRLLRRLVRDRFQRGNDAAETIVRWPSVRAGERAHIRPLEHLADSVFDSSLVYELNVLKVYAERYLLEVPKSHDAYPTACRLRDLVEPFVAIYPDHVPETSILREFIGDP